MQSGETRQHAQRPAVFLDRDGTVIVERHHLKDPEHVALVPGVAEALRSLRNAGYALVIVTNQSGIARGYFTETDFRSVQLRVETLLAREGLRLDGVYHCPHHPDFTGPCECRKPATGLYRRAIRELGLDPARSVFVGDRLTDVRPAFDLGGTPILVRSGYGREQEADAPGAVTILDDLPEAAEYVLAHLPPPAPSSIG